VARMRSSTRMDPQLGMICGSDEILDSIVGRSVPRGEATEGSFARETTKPDWIGLNHWTGLADQAIRVMKPTRAQSV
jgi:hypothetical protein